LQGMEVFRGVSKTVWQVRSWTEATVR
jgi:hypothetical protein